MFKLALTGLLLSAVSIGLLFAGYPQAQPLGVIGLLLFAGAVAFGSIANLSGWLEHRQSLALTFGASASAGAEVTF